jgi:hypothetical protein
VVKHKNQGGWWDSMKKEFHPMEAKYVWEVVLMPSMPARRKIVVIDGYSVKMMMKP